MNIMPWTTDRLNLLIVQARKLLLKEFPDTIFSADVFICSQMEMINRTKEEIKKYYPSFIIGKYFSKENIIWLVEGKGDNLPTLLHELLHSIQKCSPNRENIVDFLVHKMLDNVDSIDQKVLNEWNEIEKAVGFKAIKERLRSEGDCEDF